MKLIQSIPRETDDVTSDFDNIVANAKDCGILFILLLGRSHADDFCPNMIFARTCTKLVRETFFQFSGFAKMQSTKIVGKSNQNAAF